MNNNIQCSIESSTTIMELNSAADGIYLVPELEGLAGLPEIRTTSGVNAGYDGGWTSAQNYDARLIAIRGVIANKDIAMVEAMRRKLASLLGQGRKEQLTLRFTTEAGNAYTINVRTISCEMALQRVLNKQDFLIQLRADDPLIYDDGASGGTEAILRVQQALGGFEINFGLPLAIGGSSDATAVENGAETVYPIIKLYGPLHSPTVVNMTTNQQMQIIADLGYTINWSGWTGVSGERLAIPNELDKEAPLRLWGIDGNIEQTTYTGKNLFNVYATPWVSKCAYNGSGQVWWDGYYGITEYQPVQPNTQYTFSNSTGKPIYYGLQYYDSAKNILNTIVVNTTTFTTPANCAYIRFAIQNSSAPTWTQLEQGSTATSFEPYVGGIPAPNPQFPMPIETVTGRQTVGIVGKNFYDPNSTVFSVPANVSIDVQGDTIKVTALITTTSSNLYWRTPIPDAMLEDGKTYTISSVLGSGAYRSLRLLLRNHDGSNAGFSTGYSVTYDSRYTLFVVENPFATTGATQVTAGTTCTISNIQVEEGPTATAFEPYKAQDYEVNLGKNLINTGIALSDQYLNTNGGWATGTYTEYLNDEWANIPGTSYTFTASERKTNSTYLRFGQYKADGTFISRTLVSALNQTITTTSECYKVVISLNNSEPSRFVNPQLEKGSTASPYSAYFEPIELCKIGTWQDRIYKSNGKWWLHKEIGKMVFNGTEAWTWQPSSGYDRAGLTPTGAYIYTDTARHSSSVRSSHFTASGTNGYGIVFQYQEKTWFYPQATITTLADFKTWLGTALPSVYYALATPTTTEITSEEVLEGLEAIGDATLYVGANNIYTDTPGALPTLEVDYPTDYDETHDTVVIDSQARTITLNGADIYHLKTEESEFPVLAPGENRMYLTSATTSDTGYAEVKFKQGYLSI